MSGPEGVNITRQIFWNVHSGPDFAILGVEEGCDGDSAKKMGNEY